MPILRRNYIPHLIILHDLSFSVRHCEKETMTGAVLLRVTQLFVSGLLL